MKIIRKQVEAKGSGFLCLVPETTEDMWHIYNLVAVGDRLTASTLRKVNVRSGTGFVANEKKNIKLTLDIKEIDFDTEAGALRLSGQNVVENKYVKLGQYHTIEITIRKQFTLTKEHWDSVHLERIQAATDPSTSAELAAVVMQPGLANLCVITTHMTIVLSKIETTIPKKGLIGSKHEKAKVRFFKRIQEAILQHVNFEVIKAMLIASPGFIKDEFSDWFWAEATRTENKMLLGNRPKFLMAHSSSGFKHSLKEVLADPTVLAQLQDTKAYAETKALEEWTDMLSENPHRAVYGLQFCKAANTQQSIDYLMVTDDLFRAADQRVRQTYVDLVEECEANGAVIHYFSSLHVSGEALSKMSGVAAMLRFPVVNLDELVQSAADGHEDTSGLSSDDELLFTKMREHKTRKKRKTKTKSPGKKRSGTRPHVQLTQDEKDTVHFAEEDLL
jgi:protein pelota